MTLGYEFVLVQIVISIIGYVAHQYLNFPIERVLLTATLLSVTAPFLMLDVRNTDLSIITAMIQNSISILPEQFLGLVIGTIVTGVIHGIKSAMEYFDIQFR